MVDILARPIALLVLNFGFHHSLATSCTLFISSNEGGGKSKESLVSGSRNGHASLCNMIDTMQLYRLPVYVPFNPNHGILSNAKVLEDLITTQTLILGLTNLKYIEPTL